MPCCIDCAHAKSEKRMTERGWLMCGAINEAGHFYWAWKEKTCQLFGQASQEAIDVRLEYFESKGLAVAEKERIDEKQ